MAVFTGAGSVGAPSITFSADTDTGIYLSNNNEVGISGGGIQLAHFNSSGRAYFGRPGTGSNYVQFASNGNYSFVSDWSVNTGPSMAIVNVNSGSGQGSPSLTLNRAGESTCTLSVQPNVIGRIKTVIANVGAFDVYSGTDSVTARFSGNKNLLVGTTSDSGSARIRCFGASGGGGKLYIDTDGAFGGTDTATLGFTVFNNAGTRNNSNCEIQAIGDGSYSASLAFLTQTPGTYPNTVAERGRFSSDGYFKAKATNAAYISAAGEFHELSNLIDVQPVLNIQHTTSSATPLGIAINYSASNPNNAGAFFLSCTTTSGGSFHQLRSNGGYANIQANDANLSDVRTKRDISPAQETWDCVKGWEVVNYNYISDSSDQAPRIGAIAQQIQSVCPEVVAPYQEAVPERTDDEGVIHPAVEERLGLAEQQMMWMAIKALQEAQVRIETLEAEVAALKA